ncbi:isocitrate/isopropylmalate family dehydrogenase [Streptomyces sp. NPDC001940]
MTRDTRTVRLAVIPGDGIGPEVVAATVPTLRAALEADGHRLDVIELDWGGERFLREGAAMPACAAARIRDAVANALRDTRNHTADLGGTATTADVAAAVLRAMEGQGQRG